MEREEAIEVVKKNYPHVNESGSQFETALRTLIPELAESKDERIRQFLIHEVTETSDEIMSYRNMNKKDVLDWLEKKGEYKSADKIKPKFKVGDWINGYYTNYKVLSVNNNGYVVEDIDGNKINILFENEKFHHLWTIQDAKDGDVLEYQGEIFIIRELKKKVIASRTIEYYCCYDGEHFINNSIYSLMDDDLVNIHPSTQEQHNLLFQKMKEAGYEWSDKDRKLIKKVK